MLGVGGVFEDEGSSPVESAVVEALQRGQWSPGDLLRSLYHCLQAFVVQSRSAAISDGDTASQDALNNAAVEVAEDLRRHARLPQPPQKIQPLLGPLYQLCDVEWPSEVITDVDAQVFKAAHPFYFKLLDVQWLMRSPLLPHVHYYLLCLVRVEGEVVVLTPWHQTSHLPSVGRFVPVVSSANFRMVLTLWEVTRSQVNRV